MLTVTKTFEASWINYIGGESVRTTRTFEAGEKYTIQSRRPEGVSVDGFFLFSKYLENCIVEEL
jgi:hypothetical protein